MIQNLFPIPVGKYPIDFILTKEHLDFIINLDRKNNHSNTSSINTKVLENKLFKTLYDKILEQARIYFYEVYSPKSKVDIRITQSWINYTEKGQYHHRHYHPNSFISGIYYIQTDKDLDQVHFFNNKNRDIRLTPNSFNIWNSEAWWFETVAGELFLFPSHLEHMVNTVESPQTRISLSFNTFLVGQVGDENELTLLELV